MFSLSSSCFLSRDIRSEDVACSCSLRSSFFSIGVSISYSCIWVDIHLARAHSNILHNSSIHYGPCSQRVEAIAGPCRWGYFAFQNSIEAEECSVGRARSAGRTDHVPAFMLWITDPSIAALWGWNRNHLAARVYHVRDNVGMWADCILR